MDQFKQLHKRLDSFKSDKKNINESIAHLHKYINTKENYYKLIPDNIKTNNILTVILNDITKKIDNLDKSINGIPKEEYIAQLEAAYVAQRRSNEEIKSYNVITYAYLTDKSIKDDSEQLKSEINRVNQELAIAKSKLDSYEKENIDILNECKQIKELLDNLNIPISDIEKMSVKSESDAESKSKSESIIQEKLNKCKELQNKLYSMISNKEKEIVKLNATIKDSGIAKKILLDVKEKVVYEMSQKLNSIKYDIDNCLEKNDLTCVRNIINELTQVLNTIKPLDTSDPKSITNEDLMTTFCNIM